MHREYTQTERQIDSVVHALAVIMSLVAVTVLLHIAVALGDVLVIIAAAIYSVGLIAMFGFSTAYNLVVDLRWKSRLRRYDHAAIFMMIAGTYTPFTLISIGGATGHVLFTLVWLVALLAALLKLAWPGRFENAFLVLYLTLGWIGLVAVNSLIEALPVSALILLGVGGILYSAGVIFHLCTTLVYHNAIWHAFVVVAASCHYLAVLQSIIPR